MARVIVTEEYLENIGDAIRSVNGEETTYKPSEMAAVIDDFYIEPTGTKSITANGTGIDVKDYASANVNVPNTYTASDEGKVVSNGSLKTQTSKNINANGTVDTTENNSVVVAVPNTYTASDEGKVVDEGELVAQGSQSITENGTYDTTLKNQVVVNVSGGGGATDLFDGQFEQGGFNNSGINAPSTDSYHTKRIRSVNFTPCTAGEQYLVIVNPSSSFTEYVSASFYNDDDYTVSRISYTGFADSPLVVKAPANAAYMRLLIKKGNDATISPSDIDSAHVYSITDIQS